MKNSAFEALEIYSEMNDEDLIDIIHSGNGHCQDFLINKYKSLVKIKARAYFITGADRDDIIQEGMIGLFKAIRDFSRGKQASFYSFADLCITRQIFTAIKTASRKKHSPLNGYISLNLPDNIDSTQSFTDITRLLSKSLNPETILIEREDEEYIIKEINRSLSQFEAEVLNLYLLHKSYVEIGAITGKCTKSVDNAIQRIKRKVGKFVKQKKLDC